LSRTAFDPEPMLRGGRTKGWDQESPITPSQSPIQVSEEAKIPDSQISRVRFQTLACHP